jgi:aminopeptidase
VGCKARVGSNPTLGTIFMLVDERVKKQADILVNYSTKVREGDVVEIVGNELAKPLILEIYREVLKKKPKEVITSIGFDEMAEIMYEECTVEQLKKFPQIAMDNVKKTDVVIAIHAPLHTRLMSGVDPKKQVERSKTVKPISEYRVENTRWVITAFPTAAMAQEAEMSLRAFSDFILGGIVDVDWKKKAKEQVRLKKLLDRTKEVRIVGEGTDLTINIAGRNSEACSGEFNMPDGEVFTSAVENSAEGYIHYTYPAIYRGNEVSDIKLWFEKGKVVKAKASKGQKFLDSMLGMDKGARYIGELGIGNNFHIDRFIKNILYDEKIGGSIHIALGRGYKKTGSKNDSALHWDMIKDLRKGGRLFLDDKIVQKNGKWLRS